MMWTGSGLRSPNIPPSPNISTLLHSSINLVLIDLDQEEDQNHRKQRKREFLAIQWLGRSAFTAVGPGSVPDWATKISQALWCSQKNTKNKQKKEFMWKSGNSIKKHLGPSSLATCQPPLGSPLPHLCTYCHSHCSSGFLSLWPGLWIGKHTADPHLRSR